MVGTSYPLVPKLSLHDTSSQADTPSRHRFTIKPDCTVYRKEDQNVTGVVSHLAEFFVKFKFSTDDDPFHVEATQAVAQPGALSYMPKCNRRHVLDQLGSYAAFHIDSQLRTHSFLVLVINQYARLMRWDRGGVVFTERIYYNTEPELVEFFEYYNIASPEVRGSNLIVENLSFDALSAIPGTTDEFKTFFLAVSLDNINKTLHAQPHRYIIPSPFIWSSLPFERCTRTSSAYDVQNKKYVYMKAFWRIISNDNDINGARVYQELNRNGVRNIPHGVDFCDFEDEYHQTETHSFAKQYWVPQEYQYSISCRRLHCLILDPQGTKLEDFTCSREMVRAIRAAIIGTGLPGCDFICQMLTLTCVL